MNLKDLNIKSVDALKESFLNDRLNDENAKYAVCQVKDGKLLLYSCEGYILKNNDKAIKQLSDGDIVVVELKNKEVSNILELVGHIDSLTELEDYSIENIDTNKDYFLNDHLNDEEMPERILAICEVKDGKLLLYNHEEEYVLDTTDNVKDTLIDGNIVVVKIKNDNKKMCNILELIGHVDDPGMDLKLIALSKSFEMDFSKSYVKQLKTIPTEVSIDDIKDRLDLREELIYTIDGSNTKDMDDAISIKKNEKGNYVLGVHIADVSHYIKVNTPIFNEAAKRATSVYMANSVIPMIHHNISNGICSLNPNVDRLTLSIIMEIDKNGCVINHEVKEAVINSKKKMTYEDVNKILMEDKKVEGYEEFIDNLKLCNELSFILSERYKKRGYLHFKTDEIKVKTDKSGKAIDFIPTQSLAGQKIIEMFMLTANRTIAEDYAYMPFAFRIHDIPDMTELEEVLKQIKNLGYDINLNNLDNPLKLSDVFKKLYESGNYSVISPFILKAMAKARYSKENIGHFGLGFEYYTHFTSPIRRFNDLLVHTLIKAYNNPKLNDEVINNMEQELVQICEHISQKEVLADEAQNEALKCKMAEYMQDYINEYFNGKIINIGSKYITVRLENGIIGKVYYEDIKGGNYYFDGNNCKVVNIDNNKEYNLTDYVRVKVLMSSKKLRTIKFKLVQNLEHVKTKTLVS